MQRNLNDKDRIVLDGITYLVGSTDVIAEMSITPAKPPFEDDVVEFLNTVSKRLMTSSDAKAFPDVITLGFWMRKSSVFKLKERFNKEDGDIHLGRGIAFHIAPANVPVNYAYSLASGLLTGNSNIVRIPSKEFSQVGIINKAINEALSIHENMKPYICLVRYDRNQEVNNVLSIIADTRIIWGGDATIAEIRKSPLSPRAGEITFADRYSLAVIDSVKYLNMDNKERIAEDFYNDTYFTDQNACTSPRIVVWIGDKKEEAKESFWDVLHEVVKKKYSYQSIQGINKLASSYLMAVNVPGSKIEEREDNLIIRVKIPKITNALIDMKDNSGYFFEYDCEDILELIPLCDDKRCQTIGYIGDKDMLIPLVISGVKGIDRVVPVGKTMDFDFIWDGYDLSERLTRIIRMN